VASDEIVFTSGGSEANNNALIGVVLNKLNHKKHIVTSKIEHSSILNVCKWLQKQHGYKVTYISVDKGGVIDLNELEDAIDKQTAIISVMHVNNETGAIQPIDKIAKIANEAEVYFHCDAVQSVAKIPLDLNKISIDIMTISPHKFYGPKGIGALYIKKGTAISPLIHGGNQERGMRAGTENIYGIVGFGKVCELARRQKLFDMKMIKKLRNKLYHDINNEIDDIHLNTNIRTSLCNTLNISFAGIKGEALATGLSLRGIAVTTMAACGSHKRYSHVLEAMGVNDRFIEGSIRFSLGNEIAENHVVYVVQQLKEVINKLRRISA